MSDLSFEIVTIRAEPYAAAPTLIVRIRVSEASGQQIHAVVLRALVQIEPRRRHYSRAEEDRLLELFGEPERWGDTLRTLLWVQAAVTVPTFTGSIEVDVPIPCTYDFEVASAKYFHALDDGDLPLLFLFSGTIFARGAGGLTVEPVPWHHEANYRLPVRVWREMMDMYFPGTAWIRLRRDTFDALHSFRGRHAHTTWEETIETLLRQAREAEPV